MFPTNFGLEISVIGQEREEGRFRERTEGVKGARQRSIEELYRFLIAVFLIIVIDFIEI